MLTNFCLTPHCQTMRPCHGRQSSQSEVKHFILVAQNFNLSEKFHCSFAIFSTWTSILQRIAWSLVLLTIPMLSPFYIMVFSKCLIPHLSQAADQTPGGVWTPAAIFGKRYPNSSFKDNPKCSDASTTVAHEPTSATHAEFISSTLAVNCDEKSSGSDFGNITPAVKDLNLGCSNEA